MNYVTMLMPIIPLIMIISGVLYFSIYKVVRKKRNKPTKVIMLAEYVLVGWVVMFLYVTQFMSFGNNFGEIINLLPFRPFLIAFRYGSNNASMVWQTLLNIFMFVPLGLLLPVVFPKKFTGFLSVFAASFAFTLATEILQLFTGRGADIDDVIANTLGGVLGFAFYVILYKLYRVIRMQRKGETEHNGQKYGLIKAVVVIIVLFTPFFAIKISDQMSKFGHIYYGHLRPSEVVIADSISDSETTATVYKYVEKESIIDLQDRLIGASGFSGSFVKNGNYYSLKDGNEKIIFIYDHNQWDVMYNYGLNDTVDTSKLPSENEAINLSYSYLEKFGISEKEVIFQEIAKDYGDENLHLVFTNTQSGNKAIVWGTVMVTIGEEGKLLGIVDNRIYCEYSQEVTRISPKKAISIALYTGRGVLDVTANISDVKPSYEFNPDTNFLIPTWEIQATFVEENGTERTWNPNIDAVK